MNIGELEVKLKVDTSEVDAAMAKLRDQFEKLSGPSLWARLRWLLMGKVSF